MNFNKIDFNDGLLQYMGHTSAMKDCILTAVVQSCEMFLNPSARSWSGLFKCGPISYSYELQQIMGPLPFGLSPIGLPPTGLPPFGLKTFGLMGHLDYPHLD